MKGDRSIPLQTEEERTLYLSVVTYRTPQKGEVAGFLQRAFEILRPYLPHPDIEAGADWRLPRRRRYRSYCLSQLRWEQILEKALGEFPWEYFDLLLWKEKLRGKKWDIRVGAVTVSLWTCVGLPYLVADCFEFGVKPKEVLGEKRIPPEVQDRVVDLALWTFREVEGVVGYITVDYLMPNAFGIPSPYEQAVGLSYPLAAQSFREKVRGYYWGNLLSREHVVRLGGEGVLARAPVVRVERIGSLGYYLQLTEDINDIDREKLAQLKAFLAPLLPQEVPQSPEYYRRLPDFIL